MTRAAYLAHRAIESVQWFSQGTTPADWLCALMLGLIVGGLAGAGF